MRTLSRLTTLACLAALAAPDRAAAQAAAGPALEVRVRSVNDLADKVEYLGSVVNQAEQAKQGAEFLRNLADEKKGIEGIDPARPFGLYASLSPNVVDSPAVLLVPIADQEAFLDLLTGKANLDPKKGGDGVYEVQVPNVPVPVFFRFANKYVYVTAQSAKAIATKELLDPKAFFAGRDDAVASALLHLDRLPPDVVKTVLGQAELKVNDALEQDRPGEDMYQKKGRVFGSHVTLAAIKAVLTDGKTVGLRLTVDPKTDDLAAELSLTGKDGSPLAEVFNGLKGRTGAAGLATAAKPVAEAGVTLTLADSVRKELAPIIDGALKDMVAKAKDAERGAAKMVADAIAPTLKAGVLDGGVVVSEAGKGKVGLLAALKVTDGGRIEKLVKQFAPFAPEDKAKFEFDVEKAGGLALHKVTVTNPELEAAFGTNTVWLATGESLLLVSVEPEGEAIRAAAARKTPRAVGVAEAEVSVARVAALAEKGLKPATVKALTADAFPNGAAGKDTFKVTVEGGDALTARVAVKGSALKLAVLLDQEKKKQ